MLTRISKNIRCFLIGSHRSNQVPLNDYRGGKGGCFGGRGGLICQEDVTGTTKAVGAKQGGKGLNCQLNSIPLA